VAGARLRVAPRSALRRQAAARRRPCLSGDRMQQVGHDQRCRSGATHPWGNPAKRTALGTDSGTRVSKPASAVAFVRANTAIGIAATQGWLSAELHPLQDQERNPAEGTGVVGAVRGEPVAISTVAGETCALSAICTHLGGVVHFNDLEKSGTVRCTAPGSRPTGRCWKARPRAISSRDPADRRSIPSFSDAFPSLPNTCLRAVACRLRSTVKRRWLDLPAGTFRASVP